MTSNYSFHTRAVAMFGEASGENFPLSIPLIRATTFAHEDSETFRHRFKDRRSTFYGRIGNPTVQAAEERLALLEEAEGCLLFASGMAAITTTILTFVAPGEHIVAQASMYGQTVTLMDRVLGRLGIRITFIDCRDPVAVKREMSVNTKLIFIETPSNPWLHACDIFAIAAIAGAQGALLVVDSTFATPFLQQPLRLGASLVIHSATKYLAGHSDVMCGALLGPIDLLRPVREMQINFGGILDPTAAWLLLRGLRTLALRVDYQSRSALEIARFLSHHPKVLATHYPFLENSSEYAIASKQMKGGGGVVSFEIGGGIAAGRRVIKSLKLIPLATSLGGVESVIEIPAELDYSADGMGGATALRDPARCLARLSVGLEDPTELIEDLRSALEYA